MPTGVSKDFLDLTRQGQRRGLHALLVILALALLGGLAAELLDPPRWGAFVWLYAGTIVAGLGLGGLAGWWETRSWAESLRASWNKWMHSAQGAGSMGEAAERAGARHLTHRGVAAVVLLLLNGAVLVAAWFQLPAFELTSPYGALAILTVSLTGLTLGAALTLRLVEAWWCRSVEQQALALVEEGRIGVWGIR